MPICPRRTDLAVSIAPSTYAPDDCPTKNPFLDRILETLKASYFPREKATSDEVNDVAGTQGNVDTEVTESMAAYTAAISKQKKLDIYNKK